MPTVGVTPTPAGSPGEPTPTGTAATGYGAQLAETALKLDCVTVETLAHFKAAHRIVPEVSYVIDIGDI